VAEVTTTRLIDDLDGSEATKKVMIGLDGDWRAIDLNDKNHAALMKGIEKFWSAASPVRASASTTSRSQPKSKKAERDYDISMLREWAGEKGVQVPPRGRIAAKTVEQFKGDLEAGWQPQAG
jgi:hypothetical protein